MKASRLARSNSWPRSNKVSKMRDACSQKHLLTSSESGLAQAEKTWGLMEPVLAAWTDAGVPGVREIAAECRSILKEGRKNVSSLSTL